jgi:hypothetical protein
MKFPEIGGEKGQKSGPDSGLFIKLKAGEKVQGVFRGDPHIFKQHWVDNRSSKCAGEGCEICERAKTNDKLKAKFRFYINFIVKIDGVLHAKIFEQSFGTFKDLKTLHESGYDLEQTLVSITRNGSGTDTRYLVLPVKDNGGLKADGFKKVHAVPLNELGDEPSEDVDANGEAEATEDDLPF